MTKSEEENIKAFEAKLSRLQAYVAGNQPSHNERRTNRKEYRIKKYG